MSALRRNVVHQQERRVGMMKPLLRVWVTPITRAPRIFSGACACFATVGKASSAARFAALRPAASRRRA
jgi:hypothetical protein